MVWAFSITAAVMTALFLWAGIYVTSAARKISEPRFRRLLRTIGLASLIMAIIGLFFLLMGIAHLNIGRTPSINRAIWFGFAVMASAFWLAGLSLRVVRDLAEPMRKAERMMTALSDQIPTTAVGDLGLTSRELEVVSVIAQGSITDAQIAEKLFISKATAATHVRNILKKAGLSNRRDLMLLGGWSDVSPAYRPVRH